MPNSFSPADLQEKYDENWSLSSSEINSLIRSAKRLDVSNNSYSMQYSDVVLRNEDVHNPPFWFPIQSKTLEFIEPFSVFTVAKEPENHYFPFLVDVEVAEEDSEFGLLTNGESLVNPVGLGRFIDYQEPVVVRFNPADPPEVNQECGPLNGEFTVSKSGNGLLCLAIEEGGSEVEEATFAKVVLLNGGGSNKVKIVTLLSTEPGEDTCLYEGVIGKPNKEAEDYCTDPIDDGKECFIYILDPPESLSSSSSGSGENKLTIGDHFLGYLIRSNYSAGAASSGSASSSGGDKRPVYAIRIGGAGGGGGTRMFKCTIEGTLDSTDSIAHVSSVESLSGGSSAGITKADNYLHKGCIGGSPAILIEDKSGSKVKYLLLDVDHKAIKVVDTLTGGAGSGSGSGSDTVEALRMKDRTIIVPNTADDGSEEDLLTFESLTVVIDVSATTTQLTETSRHITTIHHTDDSDDSKIADIDDCAGSS